MEVEELHAKELREVSMDLYEYMCLIRASGSGATARKRALLVKIRGQHHDWLCRVLERADVLLEEDRQLELGWNALERELDSGNRLEAGGADVPPREQ